MEIIHWQQFFDRVLTLTFFSWYFCWRWNKLLAFTNGKKKSKAAVDGRVRWRGWLKSEGKKIYVNFSCYYWRSLNYNEEVIDHLVESLIHWEGGSTQERFKREGSAPRSSHLPFCIPFNYDRNVPLSHT